MIHTLNLFASQQPLALDTFAIYSLLRSFQQLLTAKFRYHAVSKS